MGGESFITASWGKTTEEAFKSAVERAEYDHGHAGYTGTIAEKDSFLMVKLPEHKDPIDFANELIKGNNEVSDKWGPCGCIEIPNSLYKRIEEQCYIIHSQSPNDKLFIFFGWASS